MSSHLITDNVLVAFETMHYLNNKRNWWQGEMVLKLDMSKAFDRVEWGCLKDIILKMGFFDKWVNIIMLCVTSITYSVRINGTPKATSPLQGACARGPHIFFSFLVLCKRTISFSPSSHKKWRIAWSSCLSTRPSDITTFLCK